MNEVVPSDAAVTATTINPSNLDAGSSPGTAVFYVGNSGSSGAGNLGAGTVTQATFTNEGLGRVKICKTSSTITPGTVFNFTVGEGVGPTQASVNGFCSIDFTLPVGPDSLTITEAPGAQGAHISTTWIDTQGEGGSGKTATVTVPFNTENKVTFDNEINSGMLEICKQQTSPQEGELNGVSFPLVYSWTGGPAAQTAMLQPGQCTNDISVPTLTPSLVPVQITVYEGTVPQDYVYLASVSVGQGPDTVATPAAPLPHLVGAGGSDSPSEVLNSLEGVTNLTFTNELQAPPST